MASRSRGRKKTKLRDLSRLPPTTVERALLYSQFVKRQSPIVTAILGQSLLEIVLDETLRTHFARRDDETWEKLTDDVGPFSTFHSKIIAAYAFGTCNEVVRDGLHTVRSIRNAFAHSKKPIDFSHELIVRALTAVPLPAGERTQIYKLLSMVRCKATGSHNEAHDAYICLCLSLELQLEKKLTARVQARVRRIKRSYRNQLVKALMSHQPKPSRRGLLSSLQSRSAGPSSPDPAPSPAKPRQKEATAGRNKGKK